MVKIREFEDEYYRNIFDDKEYDFYTNEKMYLSFDDDTKIEDTSCVLVIIVVLIFSVLVFL